MSPAHHTHAHVAPRPSPSRSAVARGTFLLLVTLSAAACRDRSPAPETDSALARDIALAQRSGQGPEVFNDAPLGGTAPASTARGAPATRNAPPRASTPTPAPIPRPRSTTAPVMRVPRPAPQAPVAEAPAPGASSASTAGVIGAGTRVGMTTNGKVCTSGLLVGDKFTATVNTPTVGTNGAVIPAGATVVLEVASVQRGDPMESSRIQFRVRSIDVNGESQAADGDVATLASLERVDAPQGNDRGKVIGGAIAGAVLGRILGGSIKATVIGGAAGAAAGTVAARRGQAGDACLPQGSPLRLTLSRDIVVRRSAL